MPRIGDPSRSRVPSRSAAPAKPERKATPRLSEASTGPGGRRLTAAQREAAKLPWGADPATYWKSVPPAQPEKTEPRRKVATPRPSVSEASTGPGGRRLTAAQREAAKLPWGAAPARVKTEK